MDRREFIRRAASTGLAGIRSRAALLLGDRRTADPVVVVGAGLAGLHSAGILRTAGQPVIVLEAADTAGGRVQTVRDPFDDGLYAEAGPIRIKGGHRTVLRLVRAHRLRLAPFAPPTGSSLVTIAGISQPSDQPVDAARWRLDLKPEERGRTPRALLEQYLGNLPADLADPAAPFGQRAWEGLDRMTWPDWLRSRGASPGAVTLITAGGDSKDLSALYVLRQIALVRAAGELDFKIDRGMDQLPRAMAAALGDVIRYRSAVVKVRQEAGAVRIDYERSGRTESVTGRRVILAVPFSTLRRIEITPALSPAKARAIDELPYFPTARFLVQSRTRFWREAGWSGYARTDRPAEIWDCTHNLPGSRGILGVSAGGAVGRSVLNMSSEESVAFGKGLVADAFPAIHANFEKGIARRWALEQWSRGAFAVWHPGQGGSIMPNVASAEGRVHFAGEHTSAWMGWMEGALLSAERAAQEVLATQS